MSELVRLWVETSWHPAFRCGGWAFVRAGRDGLSGKAGGDRATTEGATVRAALKAALADLPAQAEVRIWSASPRVLTCPLFAGAAAMLEEAEGEAWKALAPRLAGRKAVVAQASPAPRTATAFTAAWADQGRDRAKSRGGFAAAIPRSNLANAGVPAA